MNVDWHGFSHGPVHSKVLLCQQLATVDVARIYVLGSWNGVLPLLLYASERIKFGRMILVDLNSEYNAQARLVCNAIECEGRLEILETDANTVEYDSAVSTLVINTSTDNMISSQWYDNIPMGFMVAVQGRTGGHHDCVQPYNSLEDFNSAYTMTNVRTLSSKTYVYPEHQYTRYTKIGIK